MWKIARYALPQCLYMFVPQRRRVAVYRSRSIIYGRPPDRGNSLHRMWNERQKDVQLSRKVDESLIKPEELSNRMNKSEKRIGEKRGASRTARDHNSGGIAQQIHLLSSSAHSSYFQGQYPQWNDHLSRLDNIRWCILIQCAAQARQREWTVSLLSLRT